MSRRVRRSYPDTVADVRARLTTYLRERVDTELGDGDIETLLRKSLAWSPQGGRVLDAHLATRPDAFHQPDTDFPNAFNRLAHALSELGYDVTLPICASCRKPASRFCKFVPEGRLCNWCSYRDHRSLCPRCGRMEYPVATRNDGVICRRCYNRDPEFLEDCAGCGRNRRPTVRLPDGRSLCWACAPRPRHICCHCGVEAPAKAQSPDGPVCARCYEHPTRACGRCGRVAVITHKATNEHPDLCRRCGPEPQHTCGICGRSKSAKAFWPIGPACRQCYRRTLEQPALCTGCGDLNVLIGRSPEGGGLCPPCSGAAVDYTCVECRRPGRRHRAGRCARCSVRYLAHGQLQRGGKISTHLSCLVEELAKADPPESTLRWLDRPRVQSVLDALAPFQGELTHRTLDELPRCHTTEFIRALLVQSGALPLRNEPLARVEAWLGPTIEELPPAHAKYVGPYAHWSVLRRARRQAVRRHYGANEAERDRSKIRAAIGFLSDLAADGKTLIELDQAWLDRWVAGNNTRASIIAGFVAWSRARKLTNGIHLHHQASPLPVVTIDAQDQLQRLRDLLDPNSSAPLNVRAAGTLVLLYGLPVTRIHRLTADDLTTVDGQTFVTVGRRPLLLPPVVAKMLRALAQQPRRGATGSSSQCFLFPSNRAVNAPMAARRLTLHLNNHGVFVRAERNSALITLASDLPTPILAEALGMHINTALRWSSLAARDWSHYLQARNEHTHR